LSANLQRKVERLSQLLEKLAKEASRGTLIVVEGQNDVRALRQLAVEGNIISAKTCGKTLLDVVSEVEERGTRDVVLLMDFDRRGKEWTMRLKQHLEKVKVTPNLTFWNKLLGIVGREVKDVEGLAAYMETLKKKTSKS